MKTTNKFLIGAVAAFIAAAANAAYVFSWTLSEDEWQDYSYAVIAAYQDSSKVGYLYDSSVAAGANTPGYYSASTSPTASMADSIASSSRGAQGDANITYLWNNKSTGQGYTYVIELYNSNNTLVDSSVSYTFDSLFTKVYEGGTPGQAAASVVKVSMDIPEPAGAMLLLLGMGLLGLKRKNA